MGPMPNLTPTTYIGATVGGFGVMITIVAVSGRFYPPNPWYSVIGGVVGCLLAALGAYIVRCGRRMSQKSREEE